MDNAESVRISAYSRSQILVTYAKHQVLAFQDKLQKAHLNHRRRGRALGRRAPRRSDPGRCRCCSGCRYPSKTSPPPPAARTDGTDETARWLVLGLGSPDRPRRDPPAPSAIRRAGPEEAGFREARDQGTALSGEGPSTDNGGRPAVNGRDRVAEDVNLPLLFFG
jgi:hypothetical protein